MPVRSGLGQGAGWLGVSLAGRVRARRAAHRAPLGGARPFGLDRWRLRALRALRAALARQVRGPGSSDARSRFARWHAGRGRRRAARTLGGPFAQSSRQASWHCGCRRLRAPRCQLPWGSLRASEARLRPPSFAPVRSEGDLWGDLYTASRPTLARRFGCFKPNPTPSPPFPLRGRAVAHPRRPRAERGESEREDQF